MRRCFWKDDILYYIVRSEFRDQEEWVVTWNKFTGLSLGWLRLKDIEQSPNK